MTFVANTSEMYVLSNSLSGPTRRIASSPDNPYLTMVFPSNSPSEQWYFSRTEKDRFYRLHTKQRGDSTSFDIINDRGINSIDLWFYETGKAPGQYLGQYWSIDPWGDGTFKLSNNYTGLGRNLDVYSDGTGPHLAEGISSGQHWTLARFDPLSPVSSASSISSSASPALSSSTSSSTNSSTSSSSTGSSNSVNAVKHGGLSRGGIAGVVIGSVVAFMLLCYLCLRLATRHQKHQAEHSVTNIDDVRKSSPREMTSQRGERWDKAELPVEENRTRAELLG